MNKPFKEHVIQLALDKPLYIRFLQLQADKKLGRPYAGLLAFVEGMYRLGYLSKEDYEKYSQRYSKPLEEDSEKPLTLEDLKSQEQLNQIKEKLKLALEQFETMPQTSKQYYLKKAHEFKELPEAQLFIQKCRETYSK